VRRILAALLFGFGIIAAPLLAQAAPCAPSMTFTTGQTLTAAVLNSNPVTFSGCFSNIDYTNIGAAGIFASQMMPTNSSQATFGGGQNYTFTNNLTVGGTLTAAVLGGLYPSAIAPTTTGQGTFGGSVPITFPNGTITTTATSTTVNTTTANATTVAATYVNGTVGGSAQQILPVYVAGQVSTSQASAHIEYVSVPFAGTFNFLKPFDVAPICEGTLVSGATTTQYTTTAAANTSCAGR